MDNNILSKRERLKKYLISVGCNSEDIDNIIDSYTNTITAKAYDLGWRHFMRVNKQARAYSRNLALEDYTAFEDKWIGQIPTDTIEEFRTIFYSNLPFISG